MISSRLAVILAVAAFALAGCGTTPTDRGLSGAAIGGAAGAAVGALVGAPLIGAAVGAGAGAITGASTNPTQIDLGKPVWE